MVIDQFKFFEREYQLEWGMKHIDFLVKTTKFTNCQSFMQFVCGIFVNTD